MNPPRGSRARYCTNVLRQAIQYRTNPTRESEIGKAVPVDREGHYPSEVGISRRLPEYITTAIGPAEYEVIDRLGDLRWRCVTAAGRLCRGGQSNGHLIFSQGREEQIRIAADREALQQHLCHRHLEIGRTRRVNLAVERSHSARVVMLNVDKGQLVSQPMNDLQISAGRIAIGLKPDLNEECLRRH